MRVTGQLLIQPKATVRITRWPKQREQSMPPVLSGRLIAVHAERKKVCRTPMQKSNVYSERTVILLVVRFANVKRAPVKNSKDDADEEHTFVGRIRRKHTKATR